MVMVGLVIAGSVILVAAFAFWPKRRPVSDDEVYRFRCPSCGQKLRYFAHQEGHAVFCPRCRGATVLPPIEDEDLA